jgi:photosystem II stability/assembly factor-like uncharacterized protein
VTPSADLYEILAQLQFVDAQNGFALTRGAEGPAVLYHTQDGGVTWTPAAGE